MNHVFLIPVVSVLLMSCTTLPELYQSIEDIANDDGIELTISREAIQKKNDVNVNIEIKNNDKN